MSNCKSQWQAVCGDESIRHLLRNFREKTSAESASILLLEDSELRFCVADGLNAEALMGDGRWEEALRIPLSYERGVNSIAALMGKTLCLQKMDERHNRSIDEKLKQKTHSILVVPLVACDAVVGTLSAINAHFEAVGGEQHRFTQGDLATGESIAWEISQRIDVLLRGGRG